ncbi:signal peptidase II [Ehrlichia muris]|nr:signal peptidase II [Ehrlichia muris]
MIAHSQAKAAVNSHYLDKGFMSRYVLIICVLIFVDQLSKWYIMNLIGDVGVIEVFSFLRFSTVWNTGISFGMLHDFMYSNLVFCSISILITFVLFYLLIIRSFHRLPLAIVIGGSIGNILDRVRHNAVYDFIDFYINQWHWPTFNLADSFIFLGIVIIIGQNNSARQSLLP